MLIIARVPLMVTFMLSLTLMVGCESEEKFVLGEFDEAKAGEVKKIIANELQVGSTASDIEEFFTKHDITHSYDEFSRRYQAIIRDIPGSSKANHAIIIYVYVDDEIKLKKYEVEDSFR